MRRPIDVWIASGYLALYGAVIFGFGAWLIIGICIESAQPHDRFVNVILIGAAASITALGASLVIAGYGVWSLKNWGRVSGAALLGLVVISDAIVIVRDVRRGAPIFPDYFTVARTAFHLLVIGYLLRSSTRDLFTPRLSGQSSS